MLQESQQQPGKKTSQQMWKKTSSASLVSTQTSATAASPLSQQTESASLVSTQTSAKPASPASQQADSPPTTETAASHASQQAESVGLVDAPTSAKAASPASQGATQANPAPQMGKAASPPKLLPKAASPPPWVHAAWDDDMGAAYRAPFGSHSHKHLEWAVRILQPRRIAPFDPATVAPPVLASDAQLPRLVVFDLDHTLWTPELYTLRHLPGYDDASPPFPVAGEDVWLLDGAEAVLHVIATHEQVGFGHTRSAPAGVRFNALAPSSARHSTQRC